MEQSILLSTKKNLGIAADYTVFDQDILTHINTAFFNLTQLGLGPVEGFVVEDDTPVWADFTVDIDKVQAIKTYVYLKVRQLFDPPTTSYLIQAWDEQIQQLEWRLNVHREETDWIPGEPLPFVMDGGDA